MLLKYVIEIYAVEKYVIEIICYVWKIILLFNTGKNIHQYNKC